MTTTQKRLLIHGLGRDKFNVTINSPVTGEQLYDAIAEFLTRHPFITEHWESNRFELKDSENVAIPKNNQNVPDNILRETIRMLPDIYQTFTFMILSDYAGESIEEKFNYKTQSYNVTYRDRNADMFNVSHKTICTSVQMLLHEDNRFQFLLQNGIKSIFSSDNGVKILPHSEEMLNATNDTVFIIYGNTIHDVLESM